jgi:hypothetical protein
MNRSSQLCSTAILSNYSERQFALVLLLMAVLSLGPLLRAQVTTVHRWYSPTGTGDGSSKANAAIFNTNAFASWMHWAVPATATNIVLHFLPGTHHNVRIRIGSGYRPYIKYQTNSIPNLAWNITNINIYIQGGDSGNSLTNPPIPASRPEETVLVYPENYNDGSSESGHGGAGIINVQDSSHAEGGFTEIRGGRLLQARRVVVENLVLDCNWRNQRAFSSLGSPSAFKMYGVNAIAATGRFRYVIVRDHGSHGLICASQFDSKAGVEAFPLMVQAVDDGQEPAAECSACDLQLIPFATKSDPRPWLIEGCEIHGFNNIWGGYNTAIMVNVVTHDPNRVEEAAYVNHHPPAAFLKDKDRRFALVRNCQIRGGAYAFGQAGPGYCTGSTFTGNAVVGSGGGYNADTHAVISGDITNSAILDAHVGVRQVSEGYGMPVSINYHTVAGNLIRISSRSTYRRYQDYRTVSTTTISDPTLVLGCNFTNTVSCFHINGITRGPVFRDNLMTTRAMDRFYTPNPEDLTSAVFRPIWWQTPTEVFPPYETGSIVRLNAQDVSLLNNRISASADNFIRHGDTLGDEFYSTFNNATAPAYTTNRPAAEGDPNFQLASRTERVVLFQEDPQLITYSWKRLTTNGVVTTVTETRQEPRLTRVREVQIQKPWRYSPLGMKVNVRLVDHWLPTEGKTVESEFVQGEKVYLRVVGPGVDQTFDEETGQLAQFSLPITNGVSGSFTLTAWWLKPGEIDYNYHGAFSTTQFDEGTVVSLSVSPDVANDRNTSFAAQRPVFAIRRSGPTTDPLTVNLELPPYTVPRFNSSGFMITPAPDVAGTYGTGTGQDYVLKRGATTIIPGTLPNRTFTVTIAAGDSFTNITLYPTYDDLTENEVAYLRVASGSGYAIGSESTALAFIYDGPEFVVKELTDPLASYGSSSAVGINGDVSPAVAGTIYVSSGGYSGNRGGKWSSSYYQGYFLDMRISDYPGYTPEPSGVADTIGGQTWYVGSRLNGTKRVPWRGWPGAITDLRTLKPNGAGEALAIANNVADVRRIVGWTEHTYKVGETTYTTPRRPAMWRGIQLVAEDLGSLSSSESLEGAALAVNSLGNIGGWSMKKVSNPIMVPIRGFLIDNNRAKISSETDARYPIGVEGVRENGLMHSIVYGIEGAANSCGVSHYKPGVGLYPTNAVVWRGSEIATLLKSPDEQFGSLVHADALLFTKPQYSGGLMRPVGRVWTNNINSSVAVIWNSDRVAPALLSDSHFTLGSGWILRRPRGSNSSGWIVGDGLYNGASRGFVMIRRN